MTDLHHAATFLQSAYTILLALALTEAFKQVVPEKDDPRNLFWDRLPAFFGFLFLIFPFFHGMSRYLFTTYLSSPPPPKGISLWLFLMGDGISFMLLSALFFVMSRSLQPARWKRYYGALALLLFVDSVWAAIAVWRGVDVAVWLVLNMVLAYVMLIMYLQHEREPSSVRAHGVCAATIAFTTIFSYFAMKDFYFP